jgi:predicted esterase
MFMRTPLFLMASLLACLPLAPTALAKDKKPPVPSAEKPEDVKKGKTALLKAPKGMVYFLKVPKKYDPKVGAPLLVFMHGSNMNGMQYLPMFGAKKWYDHAILCCPNGEQGDDPFGSNNFTQQAAPLVADVTEQVQKAFNITHTYIGGHSQGGFVTYSVIMHFPQLFDGALPMAGDCWMQNEPNLWEDNEEMLAKQMRIPIAIIHGKADPVVSFSQGEHAFGVFHTMGYPKLRLFAPERLGHQFGLSPVGEALTWLDAMNGIEPKAGLKAAGKWAKAREWGWVHAAGLAYSAREDLGGSDQAKARKLITAAEAAAAKAAPEMQALLEEETDPRKWLPAFWEFRHQYGRTEAAKSLIDSYTARRQEQRQAGAAIWREAFGNNRQGNKDKCFELLEKLLQDAPYSFDAYYAVAWLDARDDPEK